MSLVLAIDTSGGTQVAVVHDGVAVAGAASPDPRGHAEHAAPLVAAVLAEAGRAAGLGVADLTAIAVGTGPAPFTGLRVGLITALALGRARGIPVHGVPSLEGWAFGALGALDDVHQVRVVTDARRREVYTARYAAAPGAPGGLVVLEPPRVVTPAELAPEVGRERAEGIAVVGPGLFAELLGPAVGTFDVAALAVIGLARAAAGVATSTEPLYLRRPDVHGVPGALTGGAA